VTPTTANSPRCSLTREITVEHPFGSIKQWLHQGALPMRGLGDVRRELSPAPLIYNLRRALNILGVGP
jgi:transposase